MAPTGTGSASVVVRRMTDADIPACVALVLAEHPAFDRAHWLALLGRDIASPGKHPVVATIDGTVVGYARTMPFEAEPGMPDDTAPDGYYLLGLMVAASFRRRGIGRLLTDERLRWLRGRAEEVWYFTEGTNLASQRLHEAHGFERVTDCFSFPGFAPGHDHVLYRLRLDAT